MHATATSSISRPVSPHRYQLSQCPQLNLQNYTMKFKLLPVLSMQMTSMVTALSLPGDDSVLAKRGDDPTNVDISVLDALVERDLPNYAQWQTFSESLAGSAHTCNIQYKQHDTKARPLPIFFMALCSAINDHNVHVYTHGTISVSLPQHLQNKTVQTERFQELLTTYNYSRQLQYQLPVVKAPTV